MSKYIIFILILLCASSSFAQAGIALEFVCDTCDWTTWLLWEAARDDRGDLVGYDSAVVGERAEDETTTDHTGNVQVGGFTADATRDITMIVPKDLNGWHGGIADTTGKYYLLNSTLRCIRDQSGFLTIDGFYLVQSSAGGARSCIALNSTVTPFINIVKNNILETAGAGALYGIDVNQQAAGGGQVNIVNNLFVNEANDFSIWIRDQYDSLFIYNNTMIGGNNAINWIILNDNASLIYNNVFDGMDSVIGATDAVDFGDYNSFDGSNWGEDYTPGSNDNASQTFTYVASGSGDYHLDDADAGAQSLGTDLSGATFFPFDNDIDDDTRSSPWDIGYDQIVGGAAPDISYVRRIKEGEHR